MNSIKFSMDTYYTDGKSGITIRNQTKDDVFNISSVSGNGTQEIVYDGTWGTAEPEPDDVIVWFAKDTDYQNGKAEPLPDQSLQLINCAN